MSQTAVGQQLWQMLQMVVFGWCLMLTAQQKQALAICGRWSYRQKMIGDFLFCLLWSVLFWLFLLQLNGGLLRNYILFGLVGGCGLYYGLFRRLGRRFCMLFAKGFLCFWRWLCRILLFPWRLLARLCWYPCRNFFQKFLKSQQELVGDGENIIENENNFST